MSIMSATLDWLVFGADEHGTPTTDDGTSYSVYKWSGQDVWTVRQTLSWPRTPGRPIPGPPPPGARYVEATDYRADTQRPHVPPRDRHRARRVDANARRQS